MPFLSRPGIFNEEVLIFVAATFLFTVTREFFEEGFFATVADFEGFFESTTGVVLEVLTISGAGEFEVRFVKPRNAKTTRISESATFEDF